MNKQTFPIWYFVPIQVPIELLRTVFPTKSQQLCVRTGFVRQEPLGLRCLTKRLAICVVEDASKHLDILTLEFQATLERPPFLPEKADAASAACPAHPGSLAMTSITFAAGICDADEPCSMNSACEPESFLTMSPRSTTWPLYFWCFGSNSALLRWQMSIKVAKWTFLFSLCASGMTSFLLFTSSNCHAGTFSSFSQSLSTAAFASGIFIAWGTRTNLCTKL